jgi:hypothetical protein
VAGTKTIPEAELYAIHGISDGNRRQVAREGSESPHKDNAALTMVTYTAKVSFSSE